MLWRMTTPLDIVTLTAALGSGLIAGVCFAFSNSVLPALARLPGQQGMSAMQTINLVILNRAFLGAFVGTALACAVLLLHSLWAWSASGAGLRLAGSSCYLLGVLVVTRARNIPENDRLAALPAQAEQAAAWAGYVRRWTFWNDVRWLLSLAASALFVLACCGRVPA